MNELWLWMVAHYELIVGIVAVVLAGVYASYKGIALDLVAQAWGVIVGMAKDVLVSIPESDFEVWAMMIYDALPTWAAAFTSPGALKTTLMKWRDLLAAKYGAQVRGILSDAKMRGLMNDVTEALDVLLT